MMQLRTKLVAAGLAVVLAGAALVAFASPASAAEWHAYKGDVYAGHAYGLLVPPRAESIEVAWSGAESGSASLSIFDPAGAKVGHYALGPGLTAASVASPQEGRYVLYVYEVSGGALNVRVSAPAAPAQLDLRQMPLKREDVSVSTQDAPGRLDKAVTATLKAPAVFVTLLYQGSAEGLDATVSSVKGPVVTIAGETGTAFAPGVYSSLSGTRTMDAANLDGTAYTVEIHARSFEGSLVLTTLAVDFGAPVAPEKPADVKAPAPPATPWTVNGASPTFAFESGKAYAFQAKAGKLLLADPAVEAKTNDTHGHDEYRYFSDAVSIYAPDDSLLAYVEIDHETPNATVELPVEGEYVAFVHHASDEVVLAKLVGATSAPALRELPLVEETFEFEASDLFAGGEKEFTLTRVPVLMHLAPTQEGVELLAYAEVANEDGVAVAYNNLARTPGVRFAGGSWADPSVFQAGTHVFRAGGVLQDGLTLSSLGFDRAGKVVEAEVEEPAGDWFPLPPAPPGKPAAPAVPGLGVLGLFG